MFKKLKTLLFPNKTDMPEKVYKYRAWSNSSHKNLLLHNELYLASPKDFNDPFDCRITADFINASDSVINKWVNDLSIKLGIIDTRDLLKRLENRVEFQNQHDTEVIYKDQDRYYGVLSLSCKWNSILMWSHYSASHKGFCVGFWEEKLRNSGFFGKGGKVEYDEKYPNIEPKVHKDLNSNQDRDDLINRTFIQTHTKSIEWNYENEYRLFQNYFPNIPKPYERLIHVLDDVFAEVILGINISEEDKVEIIDICKKKNIPVFQAIKKPFMFKIEKVEI